MNAESKSIFETGVLAENQIYREIDAYVRKRYNLNIIYSCYSIEGYDAYLRLYTITADEAEIFKFDNRGKYRKVTNNIILRHAFLLRKHGKANLINPITSLELLSLEREGVAYCLNKAYDEIVVNVLSNYNDGEIEMSVKGDICDLLFNSEDKINSLKDKSKQIYLQILERVKKYDTLKVITTDNFHVNFVHKREISEKILFSI